MVRGKGFAVGMFVALACSAASVAQTPTVVGSGTLGTQTASYICPPIAIFSHGLIAFRITVTATQAAPSEASGVFQARCSGFNSSIDTVPITAIIEIGGRRAWVRGSYDLERAGYSDCVDAQGRARSHIDLDLQLEAGKAGADPAPTIHASSVLPAGGISCTDPTGQPVVFQNFDGGAKPLLTGEITVTQPQRTNSN